MDLNLGGSVLDVAIGLAFVFFMLSIVVTAITEGIAWATKQRAATLEKGLKGMLGDDDLAAKLLGHPLVRGDLSAAAGSRPPSYLSPRNFSAALVEILKEAGGAGDSMERVVSAANSLAATSPDLGKQLNALLDQVDGDLKQFRKEAEGWFDDAMDRVSGWYKRWSQAVACGVALVVAIGLNANAIQITERLSNEPTVRASVATAAEAAVAKEKSPEATGAEAQAAVEKLESLKVPLLWPEANTPPLTVLGIGESILGWLIAAIAISLGAPFWFDTLSKLSRLKTAGKEPQASK